MRRAHRPTQVALIALAWVAPLLLTPSPGEAGARLTWEPASLHPGEVALVVVTGVPAGATVTGSVAGRPVAFFPHDGGSAGLAGIDIETPPGRHAWKIDIADGTRGPRTLTGRIKVTSRSFPVEHLTLPPQMVDLDEETTRRADAEAKQLRSLFRMIGGERLWRGPFATPVGAAGPGAGFGAGRVINGQPRARHSGLDYAAPRGTAVVAANSGRVALVGDFFFPGRLVVLDHGFGLYTAYFHLDRVLVDSLDRVDRGQAIGEVGSTGRATGPHLHFAATVGSARVDPTALFRLRVRD